MLPARWPAGGKRKRPGGALAPPDRTGAPATLPATDTPCPCPPSAGRARLPPPRAPSFGPADAPDGTSVGPGPRPARAGRGVISSESRRIAALPSNSVGSSGPAERSAPPDPGSGRLRPSRRQTSLAVLIWAAGSSCPKLPVSPGARPPSGRQSLSSLGSVGPFVRSLKDDTEPAAPRMSGGTSTGVWGDPPPEGGSVGLRGPGRPRSGGAGRRCR